MRFTLRPCGPLVTLLLTSTLYGQTAPQPAAPSARERLVAAAALSHKLRAAAAVIAPETLARWDLHTQFDFDGQPPAAFPRAGDLAPYAAARPWSDAYAINRVAPNAPVETFPTLADAPALRALLTDPDPDLRGLAIEALATLHQPQDVGTIGALLADQALSAPALVFAHPWSDKGFDPAPDKGLDATRPWSDRTVATYAARSLSLMTGQIFAGHHPFAASFPEWWKTNNLGRESLWYWETRLLDETHPPLPILRDHDEFREAKGPPAGPSPQEQIAAALKASALELRQLPAEAEAKILLVSNNSSWGRLAEGPVNDYFPEGFTLRIPQQRALELLAGKNIWPDCAGDPEAPAKIQERLARLAPTLFTPQEFPQVRALLEANAAGKRWMPVLVSRLLPPATTNLDDVETREGYLRRALPLASDFYSRDDLIREMVRTNVEAQWPVLEKVFQTDQVKPGETFDARMGILRALGDGPHTQQKRAALIKLILDPRNEPLFTQENQTMAMGGYRQYAADALNAFAGNRYITASLIEGLGNPATAKGTYAAFQRLAANVPEPATAPQ